jgi:hypothetical protein
MSGTVQKRRMATAADLLTIPEDERFHEIIGGEVAPSVRPGSELCLRTWAWRWLETPEAAPIELELDLEGAPASIRAGVALLLLLLAAAILATDLLLRVSEDGLSFGPVRSFWFAILLFIAGAGLFFWRLLGEHGDG